MFMFHMGDENFFSRWAKVIENVYVDICLQDQMLINVVIEQMICDNDPELGGAVQLMGILRILLDPENMLASVNKSEKTDFLNYFYKHSVHVLIGMYAGAACNLVCQ